MRILKIESLPKSKQWVDRDFLMLHACFQILKDFVEKEHGDKIPNYDIHKEFVDEIRFLYNWWINRVTLTPNEDQIKEDSLMLNRLMAIRTKMWI